MTKAPAIRLGFEVGTGVPVDIPLAHTFVTGQTQLSGKTTTLQAIVERSGQRALAFVTKRGEAFGGRRILPYLPRDGAHPIHWRLVETLLASALGQRNMKWERFQIINAAKGARSLVEVRANVERLQGNGTSKGAEIYMLLGEYLDLVLPEMRSLAASDVLDLQPGLNVMDLAGAGVQLQALVIRAALERINHHERGVVTVFPEAWEFAPRGRSAPAKDEAIAMARKGAVLGNYLLCDSQDLAGVETVIRQATSVWILGVQRELNELKRTIDSIPAGIAKPKNADIATLELGQFYACWGRHAIKTFVQPTWMPEDLARLVATGAMDVANASAIAMAANVKRAARESGFPDHIDQHGRGHYIERPMTSVGEIARSMTMPAKEDSVTKDEAARLTRENEQLKADNTDLRRRLEALEKGPRHADAAATIPPSPAGRQSPPRGDRRDSRDAAGPSRDVAPGAGATASNGHVDEDLYQAIKARLLEDATTSDPVILKVLADRAEIVVEVTPRVVTVEGDTAKGRVARLMAAGWFASARAVGAVRSELARTGKDPGGGGALGILLSNLVADGFFVREGTGFVLAPGVKVSERELRVS